MTVLRGDCVEVMAGMEPDSVDAIVTDPPYDLTNRVPDVRRCLTCRRVLGGADGDPDRCPRCGGVLGSNRGGFMGQTWDGTGVAFRPETWAAALRVAKPGAYLLAFGGTRTVHRMTCALEDAGWVIRDMLVWAYAQGFPKSKASLKPAWEPIVMARKPGASRDLNIDAARIGPVEAIWSHQGKSGFAEGYESGDAEKRVGARWPANVVLTDPIFDGGWEGVVGGGETTSGSRSGEYASGGFLNGSGPVTRTLEGNTGTYSRFFLLPEDARMGAWRTTCPCCRAKSAESSSSPGDPLAGSAPSPARTEASSAATTTTASPHTNGIETTSWLDASGNTTRTGHSPASPPTGPSPSVPARPADRSGTSSGTTTTTHDHSMCGSCAAAATPSSTDEPGSAERPDSPRFLLIPKAPTRERHLSDGRRSPHPTQKPEALIRHLVTLVTPPGGLVLDPFLGSGTLGVVTDGLGMRWLGIEREPEYADWAEDRIADRQPVWSVA